MPDTVTTRTQADRADETRARILDAATREFSANGLAGARTERIAQAAGVNKALLYYYFRGKDELYAASLDAVAGRMAAASFSVLRLGCSAGERLLRFALNHFDRIYSQSIFQTLMQHEMMRLREGVPVEESPIIDRLFRPMTTATLALIEEAIASGELIDVDVSQVMYSIFGPNVFYFMTLPMMSLVLKAGPVNAEALAFRRKSMVEFLGHALFTDREHGVVVAAQVLRDTPMPESIELPRDPFKLRDQFRKDTSAKKSKFEHGRSQAGVLDARPGPAIEERHK